MWCNCKPVSRFLKNDNIASAVEMKDWQHCTCCCDSLTSQIDNGLKLASEMINAL